MDIKFENICFCCLTEEGHLKNMQEQVFLSAQLKIPFVEGYTVCSGIVPDLDSTKNICTACEFKLKSSYEFRELCRVSYQTMKDKAKYDANLYVDVKHEILSDNETEFLYDNFRRRAGKKTKARQFSQVYVRDVNLEPPKIRTSTRKCSAKPNPSELLSKDKVNEVPQKREKERPNLNEVVKAEKIEDSNTELNLVATTKRVRGPYKKNKKQKSKKAVVKKIKTAKKVKPTVRKQAPPVLNVADMDSNFQCPHCDTVLRTYNEFLEHREANHKIGDKFQSHNRVCGLCNTEVKQFVEHIAECHKDYRPCFCNYCDKGKFQTPLDLRAHLQSHLSCEATHECLSCHEMFRNEVYLRSHISSTHKNINNAYLCPYCGMEFPKVVDLHRHFRVVHEKPEQLIKKKLFPCFHCKKVYMVGKYYESHDCLKRNTDLKAPPINSVKCDRCDLQLSCLDELECHNTRGCDVDLIANKCLQCGKCFETRKKLVKHRRAHAEKKNKCVCDICGYAGQSLGILKNHMFQHVTERPYKCHLCPATFKEDRFLIIHQKIHNDDKLFECFLCSKRFRSYVNIKSHMAVHSDSSLLRKYTCEFCGKMTTNSTTLRTHMLTHTHARNVKCHLCPKAFGTRSHFREHIRKEHEMVYYECIFCGQHYSGKTKLTLHLFKHRGFTPYNCPACPWTQVLKHVFIKHLMQRHNIVFDAKLHGYQEKENVKLLLQECARRPNDTKKLVSLSGVRIVDTKYIRHKPQRYVEPETSYGTQMSATSGPVEMQKQYFMPTEELPTTSFLFQGS